MHKQQGKFITHERKLEPNEWFMQPPMPPPLLLFPMCHALLVAASFDSPPVGQVVQRGKLKVGIFSENWNIKWYGSDLAEEYVLCSSWKVFNEYFLRHSEEDPHNPPISSHYRAPMVMLWVRMEEFLLALKLSKMLIHARCEQLNIREEKYSRSRIRVLEWPPRRNNILATPSLQPTYYLHSKTLLIIRLPF